IQNNSSSAPLISFMSGNNYHVGVSGIRFNEGSGMANHLEFWGSGSKVPLVNDITFEVKNRFGNSREIAAIDWSALGGVMWNAYGMGVGGGFGGQCCPEGASMIIDSPRNWYTPSTMGALDSNG